MILKIAFHDENSMWIDHSAFHFKLCWRTVTHTCYHEVCLLSHNCMCFHYIKQCCHNLGAYEKWFFFFSKFKGGVNKTWYQLFTRFVLPPQICLTSKSDNEILQRMSMNTGVNDWHAWKSNDFEWWIVHFVWDEYHNNSLLC